MADPAMKKGKLLEMVDSFCVIRLFAHHASSGSPIFARYVTGIFNISCCAGIAWIFSRLSMRPVIRILEWFGAHSLELYLVHVTIRKFMKGAAFHTCRLRYELVLVCSSIVIAWILQILVRYITDHLLKEKR